MRNEKIKNKKTLANLLLKNYVLTYFVITILVFVILLGSLILGITLYLNINNLNSNNAKHLIKDNYKEINTTEIERLGGYIEIIDDSHKVIYRKGVNPNPVDTYTPANYYEVFSNSNTSNSQVNLSVSYDGPAGNKIYTADDNNKYVYNSAYNVNKHFLLVIAVPESKLENYIIKHNILTPGKFIVLILVIDFIILILMFLFLSRTTSKNFIKPLNILIEGARQISKGNYDTRISLKAENEFGELRDAFNIMAEEIERERLLKEKAEQDRRSLILDISHDLKNPLFSILGYSEYISKSSDMPRNELNMYLDTIRLNSERANNLIGDLFEYSKLESSDFTLNLKSRNINDFLRDIIASYIPQIEDKGMYYEFDIPEEDTNLVFDKKLLDRAISNLIINSIKYNHENTTITITAKSKVNKFIITVKDNGVGIPANLKDKIFQAFVRVDSSRNSQTGGTGLGLAITKKIIEKHGGSIYLDSDLDKGTKFILTLPIN